MVVFPLLKLAPKKPADLAAELGDYLQAEVAEIASYNVVQGFLNIEISTAYYIKALKDIRADAHFGIKTVDAAADKMETRLRRYKRRITNHHKERSSKEELNAVYKAQYNVFDVSTDETEKADEDTAPAIIAEMDMDIPEVTVSDAVMRLDLGQLQTLMFRNSGHGGINVVYRRPDGNIGWIDPKTS